VDRKWIEIKKVIGETAKEVMREKRRVKNEEWFDDECRIAIAGGLIMMQRETRQNYGRYKESRSRANRILQGKKRGCVKGWLRDIEELSIQNENRTFCQSVKWMTVLYCSAQLYMWL
jgi:hypothetical protein